MNHACPIRGCIQSVPDERLMCPGHWRRVPQPLVHEINECWGKFRATPTDTGILKRYLTARRQAIAHVDGLIASPLSTPSIQHRKRSTAP